MPAPELVILMGLPASGKSTFYARRYGGTHALVSKDRMPKGAKDKEGRQRREIETYLRTRRSVVVDNTNPRRADRASLISLGRRHGAHVVGYFFAPHVGDSLRRNDTRPAPVPRVAIFVAAKKLEHAAPDEGFDELYLVRIEDGDFDVRSATS